MFFFPDAYYRENWLDTGPRFSNKGHVTQCRSRAFLDVSVLRGTFLVKRTKKTVKKFKGSKKKRKKEKRKKQKTRKRKRLSRFLSLEYYNQT